MPKAHQATPSALNLIVLTLCIGGTLFLLWLGSRLDMAWSLGLGFIMSFILLTNYALMHEGAHYNLHKNPRYNYLLGCLSGSFFPISFTLFQVTHQVHHRCNRTDYEMFDYYYPNGNRWLKRAQWYSIMTGLYWPTIPLGSMLMALFPRLSLSAPFKRAKSTQVLFDDFGKKEYVKVRWEVTFAILLWLSLFYLLSLQWQQVLLMYLCFGFNWSTRQYVTHAFTPRDVVNGAHNLKVSRLMQGVLLNGHWDLIHHQQPDLPWTELPRYGKNSLQPIAYWKQYFKLWLGPRPYQQPGPKPLSNAELVAASLKFRQ